MCVCVRICVRKVGQKRRLQSRSESRVTIAIAIAIPMSRPSRKVNEQAGRCGLVCSFLPLSRSMEIFVDVNKGGERHGGCVVLGRSRQGVVMRTLHMHTYLQTGGPHNNSSLLCFSCCPGLVCACMRVRADAVRSLEKGYPYPVWCRYGKD